MWQRGLPPWLALVVVGAGCQFATGLSGLEAGDVKLGERCTQGLECRSGHCADGVCCDSACDGACQGCDLTGAVGRCGPHGVGTDPDEDCGSGARCDGSGACAGAKHVWSKSIGPELTQHINDVAVDPRDGSIVVVGQFFGLVDVDGYRHTTEPPNHELFLAKFDPNGGFLWSRAYGDGGTESATSVGIDGSGNILLAGTFQGTIDFGDGTLHTGHLGEERTFVAKFDDECTAVWSRSFAGFAAQGDPLVAVRSSGEFALAGGFSGVADFGGGAFDGQSGAEHAYLVKFSAAGFHLWSHHLQGPGQETSDALVAAGLAVDDEGGVVIGGTLQNTLIIDDLTLAAAGEGDIYLARFASDGSRAWAQRYGSDSAQALTALAVDGTDIVLVGASVGAFELAEIPLDTTLPGNLDLLAARLDASGHGQFATLFPGYGYDENAVSAPTAVVVDQAGNMVITGVLGTPIDFGGGPLDPTPEGSNLDVFLVKLNSGGQHVLSKRFGKAHDQVARAIDVDSVGNMIAAGSFVGQLDLGGSALPNASDTIDAFVVKFSP